jgi:cytochrome c oxidase subunit 1
MLYVGRHLVKVRKRINSSVVRKISILIFLSALLAFIPLGITWIDYQLVAGLNPFLGVIITALIIIIPVLIYRFLFKTFKKYISFTPDVLFTIGFFSYLLLICLLQIYYGNSAMDIHLHDTYFVISSYPGFFIFIGFAICAATYFWFSKIFTRQMNNTLGYIHFWITFLSINFLILPTQYSQFADMPRRYYDYTAASPNNTFYDPNIFISTTTCLLLVAQLLFLYNIFNSIFKKKG